MTRSKALGVAGAAAVAAGAAGVAATALLVGAANAAGVFSGAEAVLSCALKREAVFGFLLRVLVDAALVDTPLLP